MDKPHLNVSAAIIFNEARNRILITRRNPGGLHGNLWEFPGGKIEAGETPAECLKREILEELGVEIYDLVPYETIHHEYAPFIITLHTFSCLIAEGSPHPLGCRELRWIEITALKDYPFPEADEKIVSRLLEDFTPEARKLPLSDTLDLHTFQPREVKDLVKNYLAQCHEAGFTQVRIIHGKGTGTLKRIVHGILESSPHVLSYSTAPETAGGWGATIVKLVKP
ncbi:MAG: 8-oxo-dGTP diphosphatase MutT [Deltaproteobacteria bacterium]|nr:MAG: 8-oxo-dGTP diphosphatase MutT [Deltaproteobacteria bacterium]